MKKIILIFTMTLLGSISIAQNRIIARGAEPGELYLSYSWYGVYAPIGPPAYTEFHRAIIRLTENGKHAEIVYSVDMIQEEDKMRPVYLIADATLGVLYNKDTNAETFSVSFDYGKTWIFRENAGNNIYYAGLFIDDQNLVYRGGG